MVSAPAWLPRTADWCSPAAAQRVARGSPSEARSAGTTDNGNAAAAARPKGFPAAHRLLSAVDFGKVFKAGRRRSDASFTVISVPGPGPTARLGLAVSRKVSRSAVQRNRIKRVVRESFRQRSAALPAMDIVVIARPGAAQCDNARLATSMDALLEWTARTCDASQSS